MSNTHTHTCYFLKAKNEQTNKQTNSEFCENNQFRYEYACMHAKALRSDTADHREWEQERDKETKTQK